MLLSGWSAADAADAADAFDAAASSSSAAFWVLLGAQWATLLVYAYTLLAPYLLRDSRDFGVEFDD